MQNKALNIKSKYNSGSMRKANTACHIKDGIKETANIVSINVP